MADIYFKCPSCEQRLVVEETGAGSSINCPQCSSAVQIPLQGIRLYRGAAPAREVPSQMGHVIGEKRLAAPAEKKPDREKELLADALQALGRLRQELALTETQLRSAVSQREYLQGELQRVAGELTVAENSWREFESAWKSGQETLEKSNVAMSPVLAERDEALRQLQETRINLAGAALDRETLRAERRECREALAQSEHAVAGLREQIGSVQNENARLTVELHRTQTELRDAVERLAATAADRARLASNLELKPELAHFVQVRDESEKFQEQLTATEIRLAEFHHDLTVARRECEVLRKEKIEVELKHAAVREALEGDQLHEDNQVLRDLVERLNEELRERGGPQRRRPRQSSAISSSVSDLKRWIVSRAFVPES